MRNDFIEFCKKLKLEDWNKKVTDKWTVRDVVAHMVGWEKEDAKIILEIWKNKEPPWFMRTESYDEFNQKALDFYKNFSGEELVKEWERLCIEVEKEIKKIGEEKMRDRPDLFEWLFYGGEDSHYNFHFKQIKNIVGK
jgi:hypothetical protein